MIEKIFPGIGGLLGVDCKNCDCTCTAYDPSADDTKEDKDGESVSPNPFPI